LRSSVVGHESPFGDGAAFGTKADVAGEREDIRLHFRLLDSVAALAQAAFERAVYPVGPSRPRWELQFPESQVRVDKCDTRGIATCVVSHFADKTYGYLGRLQGSASLGGSSGARLCLESTPAPWRLSTTVLVFSQNKCPCVSVPRSTMPIPFLMRPLRRTPFIGCPQSGPKEISEIGRKALRRPSTAMFKGSTWVPE
jgi:hypothetical protein